jgi:hypothetical protein
MFKPISSNVKLIGGGVLLLIVVALLGYGFYRVYNAGVNTAKVSISKYEKDIETLRRKLNEKDARTKERIITEYHEKVIYRTKVQVVNRDIITRIVPEQFNLSNGWVYAHDQASKGELIDESKAANATPSETSDKEALLVVTENYDGYNRTADQLEALQKYLKETQKNAEDVNNSK